MERRLLGKCGFYCGSCPTFLEVRCAGCMQAHETGDCYSRDCAMGRELPFCGACREFPCEAILTRPRCTVLDREWLLWKKRQKEE